MFASTVLAFILNSFCQKPKNCIWKDQIGILFTLCTSLIILKAEVERDIIYKYCTSSYTSLIPNVDRNVLF